MIKKPSVSKLVKILDKPALVGWANKIGLEGVNLKAYRTKAMADGTNIHAQIHAFLADKKPFDDLKTQNNFKKFMSNKKILGTEKDIETSFFVGRYDIKLGINGKTWMCDFKKSDGIHLDNTLQLVAYRMAEKTDCIAIIKTPEFTFHPINIKNYNPYENILEALYIIYMNKQLLGYN